jgi:hypothetical protein
LGLFLGDHFYTKSVMIQAQPKRVLLLVAMIGFALLSLPWRNVGHPKDLSRAFGQTAQLAREGSWSEAASQFSILQTKLSAIPSAAVLSHWDNDTKYLLTQEILSPLQSAIEEQSSARAQKQIERLSHYCTQCHQREGRPELNIRERPTASNVIGE